MAQQNEGMEVEGGEGLAYQDAELGDIQNQYVHNYWAPWNIYGIAFSSKKSEPFRLAVGSLLDSENNFVRMRADTRWKLSR
jgi:hypothetical protein